MDNRDMGILGGNRGFLADAAKDCEAGLVPSWSKTSEHKVDTSYLPPSPPQQLPSRLSFST